MPRLQRATNAASHLGAGSGNSSPCPGDAGLHAVRIGMLGSNWGSLRLALHSFRWGRLDVALDRHGTNWIRHRRCLLLMLVIALACRPESSFARSGLYGAQLGIAWLLVPPLGVMTTLRNKAGWGVPRSPLKMEPEKARFLPRARINR